MMDDRGTGRFARLNSQECPLAEIQVGSTAHSNVDEEDQTVVILKHLPLFPRLVIRELDVAWLMADYEVLCTERCDGAGEPVSAPLG